MPNQKLIWLMSVLLLAACGRSGGGNYAEKSSAPTAAEIMQSDSASMRMDDKSLTAPGRKIIHTADFRCKVQNVLAATTGLEQLVKSLGGVVQESHMDNANNVTKTSYYKPDSLRQVQTYTATSQLTLRVPAQYMDSVLRAIPGLTGFIDSRTLKQNDVTWTYVANELKNATGNTRSTTSQALKLARKSKEPIEVQEYEDSRHEKMVDRKMANLQLMDEVSYATVTIALSQPEQVYIQTIVNPDFFTQTPFSLQCKEALHNGLDFIRGFIVALISIWPLILVIITGASIAGYMLYKRKRVMLAAMVRK